MTLREYAFGMAETLCAGLAFVGALVLAGLAWDAAFDQGWLAGLVGLSMLRRYARWAVRMIAGQAPLG